MKFNIVADVYGDKSFTLASNLKVDAFKVHSEDFFNNYFSQSNQIKKTSFNFNWWNI